MPTPADNLAAAESAYATAVAAAGSAFAISMAPAIIALEKALSLPPDPIIIPPPSPYVNLTNWSGYTLTITQSFADGTPQNPFTVGYGGQFNALIGLAFTTSFQFQDGLFGQTPGFVQVNLFRPTANAGLDFINGNLSLVASEQPPFLPDPNFGPLITTDGAVSGNAPNGPATSLDTVTCSNGTWNKAGTYAYAWGGIATNPNTQAALLPGPPTGGASIFCDVTLTTASGVSATASSISFPIY